MCGIILFYGKITNIYKELIKSLKLLENRGYDSVGISSIKNNLFLIDKFIKLDQHTPIKYFENKDLEKKYENLDLFIGHTRWATHGIKSVLNAHPHVDYKNKFALVPNGIIDNYSQIKKYLLNKNVYFRSDTDSEVIVNLISYNYHEVFQSEKNNSIRIEKSIQSCIKTIKGTYGICLINLYEKNNIYVFKNGSPITFYYDKKQLIVASEQNILQNYTNFYYQCKNDKLYKFSKDHLGHLISNTTNKEENKQLIEKVLIQETPEPYKYWTLKEIYEIPKYFRLSLNNGARIFNKSIKLGGLENYKKVILSKKILIFSMWFKFKCFFICL